MKRPKKLPKKCHSATQETRDLARIWWHAEENILWWFTEKARTAIKSPDQLQCLAEAYSCVLVSGATDQWPARFAAFQGLDPGRVKIVLVPQQSHHKGFSGKSDAAEKDQGKVLVRKVIKDYDVPLTTLQVAAFCPQSPLDPVATFSETWMGQFHQFWNIPITRETAEFWARVGDVHYWLAPPDAFPPDLSTPVELREDCENSSWEKEDTKVKILAFFFGPPKKKSRFSLPEWPLGKVAASITARRSQRKLLPQAWAGSPDAEAVLREILESSIESLRDPRAWIWRALLRTSVAEVNLAYTEAVVAWVLARLAHPELFPPPTDLIDPPALSYWREYSRRKNPTTEQASTSA
ncbi:hypothetical protein [Thermogutta sp.]|uniref:hypothetical protein n=1 Tax=Thermogutta sp. TaxID=1962930 RepID=UPI0032209F22